MNNKEKEIVAKFKRVGKDIPQEFFDAGVVDMLTSDKTYMWRGKKYRFIGVNFEPTITMVNVNDDSEKDLITFAITSEIKDELVLIDK